MSYPDQSTLADADRILVIGCPGSGKSTLAKQLSQALDLRYISMDRDFYWLPGWRKRPRNEIDRLIADAVAAERWIMDGTGLNSFHLRLPRAEAVVWLRLPRYACLWGMISRAFRHLGRNRPDLPAGCPERISLEALVYVWNFERNAAPLIEATLRKHGLIKSTVIVRSRKEARQFVALCA